MRARAKVTFREGDDGAVRMEVLTRDRLPDMRMPDRAVLPEEYLHDVGVSLMTLGVDEGDPSGRPPGWRYVRMDVLAGSPHTGPSYHRYVDLSEGSEERRLFAALAEQETLRVVWLNEEVEVTLDLAPMHPGTWREALANTRGLDRERYAREIERRMEEPAGFGGGRPRPRRRRTAEPPPRPIPFFAPRSGALPRAGTPTVAGLRLPRGDRQPPLAPAWWESDHPVSDAVALCARLAAAFPGTGLWPLPWVCAGVTEGYFAGGDPRGVDAADPAAILREAWERFPLDPGVTEPLGAAFPGLAPASAPAAAEDPFTARAAHAPANQWGLDPRLLLVPCNRPADALAVLAPHNESLTPTDLVAVLRSWEERFGAVPVELGPGTVMLSVGSPPTTREQALLLAGEIESIAPSPDVNRPGGLAELAEILLGERPNHLTSLDVGRRVWQLGFG